MKYQISLFLFLLLLQLDSEKRLRFFQIPATTKIIAKYFGFYSPACSTKQSLTRRWCQFNKYTNLQFFCPQIMPSSALRYLLCYLCREKFLWSWSMSVMLSGLDWLLYSRMTRKLGHDGKLFSCLIWYIVQILFSSL